MATEVRKFEVGVFVIAVTILAIGVAIWLGASRFFEDTQRFVSYFAESVQGLDPGAAVKFRGVPVGRVARIDVAPDRQLIEVVMDVDRKYAAALRGDENLRAQLELSGITGLRYVEVDRRSGEALNQTPRLSFTAPHDVIPSARSSFVAIQDALVDLYKKVVRVDVGAMSAEAQAALQSVVRLLQDERIDVVLTNLAAASESARKSTRNIAGITADAKLGAAVENAAQAMQEARTLFANLNRGLKGEELARTLDRLDRLTASAQQLILGLQATTARLDRAVGSLQGLTDEVRQQPSLLFFGEPASGRRAPDGGPP
ncbi:MAG: MlaD family protein [Candidatus Binatia bacterium]